MRTETGPQMPDVKMHLANPANPVTATVVETSRCTLGTGRGGAAKAAGVVRHISFDITGTPLAGSFRPGQSFGVIPPGVDAKGSPHKLRLYSLSSPSRGEDGQGNVVATSVKRVIDEEWETHKLFLGVCSNYLCDLKPGDKVLLTGPSGKRFVLPKNPGDHDYVFFATGTGIAPFRGMVMDLLESGAASKVVLVMGSAYSSDLIYHEQFEVLAAKHTNFTYLPTISRHVGPAADRTLYVQDRLTTHRDLLTPLLSSERGLIYVCGIAGMEMGILKGLHASLSPEAFGQYLQTDPEYRDPKTWDRKLLSRKINPTRRVFLEVY